MTVFQGIAERDAALAVRHLDPDRYVEHDPYDAIAADDHRLTVVRILADRDLVVTQADGHVRGDGTFFDVFRFEGGLIVEHWGFSSPSRITK